MVTSSDSSSAPPSSGNASSSGAAAGGDRPTNGAHPRSNSITTPDSKLPQFREDPVKMKYVRSGYSQLADHATVLIAGLLVPTLAYLMYGVATHSVHEYRVLVDSFIASNVANVALACLATVALLVVFYLRRAQQIYLVDFTTWKGRDDLEVHRETFIKRSRAVGVFTEESLSFQEKILATSTLTDKTYFPPSIINEPMQLNMAGARAEAEMIMFDCVGRLLAQHGLKGRDIDILIVNCSLFCPTPSLSAMIIQRFSMRSDVLSYNLGGMGCSAGVISIDLAKQLLSLHKNCRAVVMSTENITQNWYHGNEKSMLISNTLFRCGGAAILLSNRPQDAARARYRLVHTVRTHKGADPACYQSVFQEQDAAGFLGVRLSKDIMRVAGDALRTNITTLGPLTLPVAEQIKFFVNLVARQLLKQTALPKALPSGLRRTVYGAARAVLRPRRNPASRALRSLLQLPPLEKCGLDKPQHGDQEATINAWAGPPYVPDFTKAFDHFCIHAGGRAVIDAVQKNLLLTDYHVQPSRATLSRYGNTSSSSIWYELRFIEEDGRIRRGQRVWQIAFGSGFKCNSVVWESLGAVHVS